MSKDKIPALGRGLEAVLGGIKSDKIASTKHPEAVDAEIAYIPLKDISPNPNQPRKEFDNKTLEELAQSIKEQGVIVPITVNRKDGKYFIIAGERRFRASKMAGLKEIPAYIRVVTEHVGMQMALIENIQREDLNAIEIALSLKALLEATHLSPEQLGEKIGKSRSTITNYVRLLNLPAEVQIALRNDNISMGHARAIISLDNEKQQIDIVRNITTNGLSVRQIEEMVKDIKAKISNDNTSPSQNKGGKANAPKRNGGEKPLPEMHAKFKEKFAKELNTTIHITRSQRGKGSITINFSNDKDFERIVAAITKK